jgi:hypothetical protein
MDEDPALSLQDNGACLKLRDALGVVAVGPPVTCRLWSDAIGCWHVCHDQAPAEQGCRYRTLQAALGSAHLAVLRSASYLLVLQGRDGDRVIESYNWPPLRPAPVSGADRDGARCGIAPPVNSSAFNIPHAI